MVQTENKEMNRLSVHSFLISMLVGLLAGYVVTVIGLFILALLLLQFQLTETVVEVGIILLYILSVFFAGFLMGKKMKNKKFLWGMGVGLAYYLLLIILSVVIQKSFVMEGREMITTLLLCVGGGMLGGMLS